MKGRDYREAKELYESGMSVREVAARLGVATSHAHKILRAQGAIMRPAIKPRHLPHDALIQQAAGLRDLGLNLQQIADCMGLRSRSTAFKYVRRSEECGV